MSKNFDGDQQTNMGETRQGEANRSANKNKIKHAITKALFLCFLNFIIFIEMFRIFELKPDADEGKNESSKTQEDGQRRRAGAERGHAAGAQVSVAVRRTCASTNGTGIRITPSPRHDDSDDRRQW